MRQSNQGYPSSASWTHQLEKPAHDCPAAQAIFLPSIKPLEPPTSGLIQHHTSTTLTVLTPHPVSTPATSAPSRKPAPHLPLLALHNSLFPIPSSLPTFPPPVNPSRFPQTPFLPSPATGRTEVDGFGKWEGPEG